MGLRYLEEWSIMIDARNARRSEIDQEHQKAWAYRRLSRWPIGKASKANGPGTLIGAVVVQI